MRSPQQGLRYLLALAALVTLILVPFWNVSARSVLPGALNSPGSLQVLSLILIAAATAVTYDVLFGYTGLLSFGHSLYFAVGCYATVLFANRGFGFALGAVLAVLLAAACAVLANALALRLSGIGFSMATLALAQLMYISVQRGYLGTGGEFGVTFESGSLPAAYVGLVNTRNAYWLALGLLVVVYGICAFAVRTQVGQVWQAVRENALRVQVLGYNVYLYRLGSAVFTSTLAALCGVVYAVALGGANPSIVVLGYSLSFVLMVVLGGRGVLWGAVLGALVYTFLNLRLPDLARSSAITGLPEALRAPVSQPNFLVGLVFVLTIVLLPGGLASLFGSRTRPGRSRRQAEPVHAGQEEEVAPAEIR